MEKKLIFSQTKGSRRKGRPSLRWLDGALYDLRTMKIKS